MLMLSEEYLDTLSKLVKHQLTVEKSEKLLGRYFEEAHRRRLRLSLLLVWTA